METITLHFDSNIKEKLFSLLQNFSKKELKIVEESESFLKAKAELHKDYEAYLNGNGELFSLEESEREIDELLKSL